MCSWEQLLLMLQLDPLHWVYNQKKLLTYVKGKKDFTFLKKNKSPFYNIKTGKFQDIMKLVKSCLKHWLKDMKI
jgi:hypothetical protein